MWTDADDDAEDTKPDDLDGRAWFEMESNLAVTIANLLVRSAELIEEARHQWDAVEIDELLASLDHHADGLDRVALLCDIRHLDAGLGWSELAAQVPS